MPGWAGSDRVYRLPPNWKNLVVEVRRRAGGKCQAREWDGSPCQSLGTDCDHITAGDDHSLDNLQWLCRRHHLSKSGREGAAAAAENRKNRRGRHLSDQVRPDGSLRL